MTDASTMAATISQAEFARTMGVNRSTVSRWREAGRLAMVGDQVDVEASRTMLAQSSGGRDDVKARHALEKVEDDAPIPEAVKKELESRASAQARKENALADLAEIERDQKRGNLVDKKEVEAVAADVMVLFRQLLENQAHRLAAILVGKDIDATRALIKQDGNEIIASTWKEFDRRVTELGQGA